MYTITYEWEDPITLIQVPYKHTEPTLDKAFKFLKVLLYAALISNHKYSHLTISHKS